MSDCGGVLGLQSAIHDAQDGGGPDTTFGGIGAGFGTFLGNVSSWVSIGTHVSLAVPSFVHSISSYCSYT